MMSVRPKSRRIAFWREDFEIDFALSVHGVSENHGSSNPNREKKRLSDSFSSALGLGGRVM